MITIIDHGGAIRFWRNYSTRAHLVLCKDGTVLIRAHGGAWQVTSGGVEQLKILAPSWEWDDSKGARLAIRTTQERARRHA